MTAQREMGFESSLLGDAICPHTWPCSCVPINSYGVCTGEGAVPCQATQGHRSHSTWEVPMFCLFLGLVTVSPKKQAAGGWPVPRALPACDWHIVC